MATRTYHKRRWFDRNRRHQPHNQPHNYYKYLVGILAVIVCQPAFAEDTVGVAANPQASISGSVANQAVQINQGSLSTQSFSQGHYCNGPVLSFSPYLLQTESHFVEAIPLTRNFGAQMTISVPLDGGAVETCKELGRIKLQKERLDYELIRVKECVNILKTGFTIHPSSPFYPICADVVPIASLQRQAGGQANADETTTTEAASSEQQPTS